MAGNTARNATLGGVALALLVAGGVVLMNQGGDADSSGDEAGAGDPLTEQWRTEAIPVGEASADALSQPRPWATDQAVVAVAAGGVKGYDPATGNESWTLTPPEGADQPCGASPTVNAQGVGAVLFRPIDAPEEDTCSVVAAVDTTSGELLWSADLTTPEYAYPGSSAVPVSVGAEAVTVELIEDGVHRFAVADGAELPALEVPAHQACDAFYTDWRHSAAHVVAVTSCDELGGGSELTVFDADSGAELWTVSDVIGADEDVAEVLGDAPLTLTTADRLLSFGENGENGEPLADLPLDRSDGYLDTDPGDYAIHDGALVTTVDESGQEFLGIDLTTGEELWQHSDGSSANALMGTEGGVLSVYSGGSEDAAGIVDVVARWSGQQGPGTVEGTLPEDAGFALAMAATDAAVYSLAEPDSGEEGAVLIEAYERP